jgi:hypothetical protein
MHRGRCPGGPDMIKQHPLGELAATVPNQEHAIRSLERCVQQFACIHWLSDICVYVCLCAFVHYNMTRTAVVKEGRRRVKVLVAQLGCVALTHLNVIRLCCRPAHCLGSHRFSTNTLYNTAQTLNEYSL